MIKLHLLSSTLLLVIISGIAVQNVSVVRAVATTEKDAVEMKRPKEAAEPEARGPKREPERATQKAARCEVARSVITEHLKKYDGMKSERDQKYMEFGDKLTMLIQKLTTEKVAVSTLIADQETFTSLSKELSTAVGDYADSVEKAQLLAPNCDSDPEAFKLALQESRMQMQTVRAKIKAIRDFIILTLQPDLKQARTELASQRKAAQSPRPVKSPKLPASPKSIVSPRPTAHSTTSPTSNPSLSE